MKSKPQLILYSTDSALLDRLKRSFRDLPWFGYEVGNGVQVTASERLDALWATIMAGVELFEAAPPFALHEARVLKTPTAQLQRGMPRYGIVGVATSKDDPTTPEYNLRLVLSSLLEAVNDFNARSEYQIKRIGILPDDLDLKRIDSTVALGIIQEVYQQNA